MTAAPFRRSTPYQDYCATADTHAIATGVSELGPDTTIKVWEKIVEEAAPESPPPGPREAETLPKVITLRFFHPHPRPISHLRYFQSRSCLQLVTPILAVLLSMACYHFIMWGGAEAVLQEKLGSQLGGWRDRVTGPDTV